jgi:deoxycytidylate deaminase
MALAFLSAQRSKDPNKQVGACIVSQDHIILGIGYNGFPRGCADGQLPWAKKHSGGDQLGTKYPYVVHAEANALLNKNAAVVAGAVGGRPCACALLCFALLCCAVLCLGTRQVAAAPRQVAAAWG